ncbi:MAG: hypothetical protein GXO54_02400 [Chloroflexi bacterium]|nr:hypothetical protein [Chloroflexota bacterium]
MYELGTPFAGRLFASAMPFSEHDFDSNLWDAYLSLGITHVVVLVTEDELAHGPQRDLLAWYRQHGLTVYHEPIPDFHTPQDLAQFQDALAWTRDALERGASVAVHCAAGRGRTGLFLACWAQEALNMSPEAALGWVRRYIPGAVETREQEDFVRAWPRLRESLQTSC